MVFCEGCATQGTNKQGTPRSPEPLDYLIAVSVESEISLGEEDRKIVDIWQRENKPTRCIHDWPVRSAFLNAEGTGMTPIAITWLKSWSNGLCRYPMVAQCFSR